jgi:hypothetical protein
MMLLLHDNTAAVVPAAIVNLLTLLPIGLYSSCSGLLMLFFYSLLLLLKMRWLTLLLLLQLLLL